MSNLLREICKYSNVSRKIIYRKLNVQVDNQKFSDKFTNLLLDIVTTIFEPLLLSQIEEKIQHLDGYEIEI